MKKALLALLLALLPAPALAQLGTVPYTFSPGTVIQSAEVNANFSTAYSNALNRTGGTMTGTLNTLDMLPTVTNASDLGSTSLFYRTGYLRTSLVLGQTGGNYTITWSNPAAARALTIPDPGGTDTFAFLAATQTFTNKTITSPVLGGTVTGTYSLGGTPTITSAFSATASGLGATFGAGGTGTQSRMLLSGSSGSASGYYVEIQNNGITKGYFGINNGIVGGSSNDLTLYSSADGLKLYSNSTLRWGVNSAGDWVFGASSHIADSNGTPTIASGFGTGSITGNDYAFNVVTGAGASTTGTVNFGHTFTNAPSCVASPTNPNSAPVAVGTTTTQVTLTYTSGSLLTFYVLCRSY